MLTLCLPQLVQCTPKYSDLPLTYHWCKCSMHHAVFLNAVPNLCHVHSTRAVHQTTAYTLPFTFLAMHTMSAVMHIISAPRST